MKNERSYGKHYAVAFAVILCVAVLFISGIFYWLYQASRQNIINVWNNNSVQMARDVEYYLTRPMDAVTFASRQVEEMIKRGASNEEVGAYLISETEIFSSIVDSNNTGVYGYVRGEYLDGSGWIPDDDYVPTERPWYLIARQGGGEITFVKPYLNLQTFTMMMSVSKLLEDGESVISMDIFLDGVQKMVEGMMSSDCVDIAMVVDKSGFVVTHSDSGEIGKDYITEGDEYETELMNRILVSDGDTFTIKGPSGKQMVFSRKINNEWYSVLILNEGKIFGSIQYIYIFSALVLILVILMISAIFQLITGKQREAEQLDREITAVSEIYVAMCLIDLKADRLKILRSSPDLKYLIDGNFDNIIGRMTSMASKMSADQSRDLLVQFMDISTLDERMKDLTSVSQEFLDNHDRWIRMRFVAAERDESGHLIQILWALESIDADRKQQEHLRLMAETDSMTKVRNRSSGESHIRQKMADGVQGMFILLDADHFKSVNDTYGHDVGDQVIIAIADSMRATFRDTDIVFRLGGDEFAAYAPGIIDEDVAGRVIDRLFENINGIRISEMPDRKIQVSVGATFYPADRNDSFEALYQRADRAMYESKQTEGNKVTYRIQDL